MLFIDTRVDIKPMVKKQLRLKVFINQGEKSKLVAATKLRTSADPRVISTSVSTQGFKPGQEIFIISLVDDGSKVIGRAIDSYILPDYGNARSNGNYIPQGKNTTKQGIDSLVNSRDSISFKVGNEPKKIILQSITSDTEFIELGAFTKSSKETVDQTIIFHNQAAARNISFDNHIPTYFGFTEQPLARNTGRFKAAGFHITDNKYSSAVWKKTSFSAVTGTGTFMAIISNANATSSVNTTLYIGKDLQIKPLKFNKDVFTGTSGLFTINLETPYALEDLTVYEAGGNNVVPTSVVEQEITTDIAGDSTFSIEFSSLPTWFAVAKAGSDSLAERTITWFQAKP